MKNKTTMHECSVVSDSATPWTVAHQAPLCPWNVPGKNTGVGCHFLLQGNHNEITLYTHQKNLSFFEKEETI